jgi:hypothetical protein
MTWWVDLAIENTGQIAFESLFMFLTDTTNGSFIQLSSDNFTNRDGCNAMNIQDNLPPDATRIVSLAFPYDPKGRLLEAEIDVFFNTTLSGTSMSQTITFTP